MTRRVRAAAVVVVAMTAAMLLNAPAAGAHAILQGGSVVDGQVLEAAPDQISLEFNEAITATRGGVRVHDPAGVRVDSGGTFQTNDSPERVSVALQPGLDDGTYAVTYRVSSADGHPVNGALLFSVGADTGAGGALMAQVFSLDADRPYAVAAALARWFMYVATLVVAGVIAVTWWLGEGISAERRRLVPWIRRTAWVSVVATALGLLLQTALVTGDGFGSAVDPGNLAATVVSFVGLSAAVRIAAATVVIAALTRTSETPAVAGAGLLLGSLLLEGHTLTTGPATVVWGAAATHVAAAAVWLGGLVVLAVVLRARRRADDPLGAARLVARFSALFTVAVVAVVVAGSALSWAEVRASRALVSTTYGWTLLAKVAVVVPLLGLGIYNNRRLVPTLTARRSRRATRVPTVAGGSGATPTPTSAERDDGASRRDEAWTRLRTVARLELGLVVIVLAVTGVLVSLQPAAEAAGVTGAYSQNVDFPGLGQMTFTVDPNRSGHNEIHLYLLDDTGRPLDDVEEVTLRLSQPDLDIGPLVRQPIVAGPGHVILAGPELSVPGLWQITTEVVVNRFDIVSKTVDVVVNP